MFRVDGGITERCSAWPSPGSECSRQAGMIEPMGHSDVLRPCCKQGTSTQLQGHSLWALARSWLSQICKENCQGAISGLTRAGQVEGRLLCNFSQPAKGVFLPWAWSLWGWALMEVQGRKDYWSREIWLPEMNVHFGSTKWAAPCAYSNPGTPQWAQEWGSDPWCLGLHPASFSKWY